MASAPPLLVSAAAPPHPRGRAVQERAHGRLVTPAGCRSLGPRALILAMRELAPRWLHSLPSPALSCPLWCSVHLHAQHRHQLILEQSFRSSQGEELVLFPAHREPHVSTRVYTDTPPHPGHGSPILRSSLGVTRGGDLPTTQQGPSC